MSDWKQEFHELFFNSTNADAKTRAFELKNENIPSRLFRYRPLNEYTLSELINGTVYIQNPSNFNDPYDSWIKFTTLEGINKSGSQDLFRRFLSSHYPEEKLNDIFSSPNWFFDLYKFIFQENGIDLLNTAVMPLVEDTNMQANLMGRQMMKVCCFTEINNSLAMWAHYTKGYTGICVEYDMTKFSNDDIHRIRMFPVIYVKELIEYAKRYSDAPSSYYTKDIFLECSLHKLEEWSYEREWRFNIGNGIIENDTNYLFPVIKAIYMGYRVTDAHQTMLLDITKHKGYSLTRMKIMSYGLDFDSVYEPSDNP